MDLDGAAGVAIFNLFGLNSSCTPAGSMNIFDILQKPAKEAPELPSMFHRLAPHDSPTSSQGTEQNKGKNGCFRLATKF